jgi:hypothetical protein
MQHSGNFNRPTQFKHEHNAVMQSSSVAASLHESCYNCDLSADRHCQSVWQEQDSAWRVAVAILIWTTGHGFLLTSWLSLLFLHSFSLFISIFVSPFRLLFLYAFFLLTFLSFSFSHCLILCSVIIFYFSQYFLLGFLFLLNYSCFFSFHFFHCCFPFLFPSLISLIVSVLSSSFILSFPSGLIFLSDSFSFLYLTPFTFYYPSRTFLFLLSSYSFHYVP